MIKHLAKRNRSSVSIRGHTLSANERERTAMRNIFHAVRSQRRRTSGCDRVHLISTRGKSRQGAPYPGFYLGVIGGRLTSKNWVDLRRFEDLDGNDFRQSDHC